MVLDDGCGPPSVDVVKERISNERSYDIPFRCGSLASHISKSLVQAKVDGYERSAH